MDRILATDLDGTLIPLDDSPQNRNDLVRLRQWLTEQQYQIVFVTGRHLESVQGAMDEHELPTPAYIVCDVGTSIYRRNPDGSFRLVSAYVEHLSAITNRYPTETLHGWFHHVAGLLRQEEEKQGRFKLSYYAPAHRLDELVSTLQERLHSESAPYSIIASVDPFTGDGLVDFVPVSVSKAYALDWWTTHVGRDRQQVVFAGDSGNDAAVFAAGYKCIVVGNADDRVKRNAQTAHAQSSWTDRLYLAEMPATSGVWEGIQWYHRRVPRR